MGTPSANSLVIKELDPAANKELIQYFNGVDEGFIRLGTKGYLMPRRFRDEAEIIYNLPLRSDDIFVVTFPRSGTTLTQELVWMIANDFNYDEAAAIPLTTRYTFLEYYSLSNREWNQAYREQHKNDPEKMATFNDLFQPGFKRAGHMQSPRFLKTHLPFSLLPPSTVDSCKVVYVARDPRDAAVSFYYLARSHGMLGKDADFKIFWNFFIKDTVNWTPFFEHLKEAWAKRNHPNMHFMFFEDMKKDMEGAVRKVAKFLGKELSKEQLTKLLDHLSFENFKNNPSVNYDEMKQIGLLLPGEEAFVRQGKSGGWRSYFDDEMVKQARRWIADNLRDTDFRYPHIPDSELFG